MLHRQWVNSENSSCSHCAERLSTLADRSKSDFPCFLGFTRDQELSLFGVIGKKAAIEFMGMEWRTGLTVIKVQVISIGQARVPLLGRRSHRTREASGTDKWSLGRTGR